jgi:hypothetical protein
MSCDVWLLLAEYFGMGKGLYVSGCRSYSSFQKHCCPGSPSCFSLPDINYGAKVTESKVGAQFRHDLYCLQIARS